MAITQRQQRDGETGGVLKTTSEIVKMGARGGWMPTVFSAVAVGLSCISVYMSTLQSAKLEVYVPPTIHYGRDAGGDTELFAIPLTIANDGARSAAVLSIELEVQNLKSNATKRYYSAFLGEHPREATTSNRQFAPLSIAGRGLFSDTVRFYPAGRAAETGRCRRRICLPPAAQYGRAERAVPAGQAAGPHAACAGQLPDDTALDLGSAARQPARHDRHARQGLEAGGSGREPVMAVPLH